MEQNKYLEYSRYLSGPLPPEPDPDPAPPPEPETKDLALATKPAREINRRRPTPEITVAENKEEDEDLSSLPAEERHSRKCQICRHPDRSSIEEDFLLWRTPRAIIREFDIAERSLYRHARAFGLFSLRRENLRLALDRVIERGTQAENTGDTIIRAVRAQACLTDDNRWVEPAKRMILSTEPPTLIDSSAIRNGT